MSSKDLAQIIVVWRGGRGCHRGPQKARTIWALPWCARFCNMSLAFCFGLSCTFIVYQAIL